MIKKREKNYGIIPSILQGKTIDDYCRENYGHSNWGYLDTYTKEELKKADHTIENNIVFWHEDDEEGDE